jgi:hypothetical protein
MIKIYYVLQRTDRPYPVFVAAVENIDYSDAIDDAMMYSSWEEVVEVLADRTVFTEEKAKILAPRPIKIELL